MLNTQALYVDGENVSRLDISTIEFETRHIPKRFIYQTEAAAKKAGYPGFEHVVIPRIGKESVDKAIAMDIVTAWHHGLRDIAIMSNDYDYGATALHLKLRHPEMQITLICDEARVSRKYLKELGRHDINIRPLTQNIELDDFACSVISVMYELSKDNRLDLTTLGNELKRRGIEYKKLRRDLISHKVVAPQSKNDLQMTSHALRHLRRTLRS